MKRAPDYVDLACMSLCYAVVALMAFIAIWPAEFVRLASGLLP